MRTSSISGLVVEYIVAIDVTRVLFPADAITRRHDYLLGSHFLPFIWAEARLAQLVERKAFNLVAGIRAPRWVFFEVAY